MLENCDERVSKLMAGKALGAKNVPLAFFTAIPT